MAKRERYENLFTWHNGKAMSRPQSNMPEFLTQMALHSTITFGTIDDSGGYFLSRQNGPFLRRLAKCKTGLDFPARLA